MSETQPPLLLKKVSKYTFSLYCNTPPSCIAVLSVPLRSEEREILSVLLPFVSQCASHLYCNTPPTCIAVPLGKSWWLGMFPTLGWHGTMVRLQDVGYRFRERTRAAQCTHCWRVVLVKRPEVRRLPKEVWDKEFQKISPSFARHFWRNSFFFSLWGESVQTRPENPALAGLVSSTKKE